MISLDAFFAWLSGQSDDSELPDPFPSLSPDVPEPIIEAYRQACFLLHRTQRAAGALSRFCLQQMIRDYWRLLPPDHGVINQELAKIWDRLSPEARGMIDCARKFGNIGSHFSQDRDMMLETSVDEARVLILLVHALAQEWYGERGLRRQRLVTIRTLVAAAKDREGARASGPARLPVPNAKPAPPTAQKQKAGAAGSKSRKPRPRKSTRSKPSKSLVDG